MKRKATFNLEENIAGALCYILGFLTGIFFLLFEKKNKFVRFHAMQSTITFLGLWILSVILTLVFAPIPIIGIVIVGALTSLIGITAILLWLFLMYKAYNHEKFKLPVIGKKAEKLA